MSTTATSRITHYASRVWYSCFGALLIALLPGCSKPVAKPDPNVLAKVGPVEIRVEDFDREMDLRLKANRTVLSKSELLEEMIQQELLVLRAKQAGLEKDPDFLRAQKNLLVSRYKALNSPTLNSQLTSADVQARYEQTIDKYSRPAKVRLAILYAKAEPKTSDEKRIELRQRMNEARAKALLGRSAPSTLNSQLSHGFGPLAIEYSEDSASRYQGGDIGWLDQGRDTYRWPKEVVAAGFALATNGAISDIIETTTGIYLVSRLDWRDGAVTPLSQVESGIRRQLAAEQRRQTEEAFLKKTREGVPIEIRPEAVALAKMPPMTTAKRTEPEPPAFP